MKSKVISTVTLIVFIFNLQSQNLIFQDYKGELNEIQIHYLNAVSKKSDDPKYSIVTINSQAMIDGALVLMNLPGLEPIEFSSIDIMPKQKGKMFWKGIDSNGEDYAKFLINGSLTTGRIRCQNANFNLYPLTEGLHLLIPLESLVQVEDCPVNGDGKQRSNHDLKPKEYNYEEPEIAVDSNPESVVQKSMPVECKIRILGAYTTLAGNNSADIVSLIELDIDDFNTINSNSLVDFQVEIARIVELTGYTEVGTESPNPLMPVWSYSDNILRFWNPTDGFMDEVHDLRNLYDADMCQMYLDDLAGPGGIAMEVNVDAPNAFCASLWDNGGFTPVHELGHLIGMWHNVESSPPFDNYNWEHGYYNDDNVTGTNFRTIMSYSSACNGSCPRVAHWSNDDDTYLGLPTGSTATHDNARIARFRDQTVSLFQANQINKSVFQNETVDEDEVGDIYGSATITTSNNIVIFENGSKGTYRAGSQIKLLPGFHAKKGTSYTAKIVMPCSALN